MDRATEVGEYLEELIASLGLSATSRRAHLLRYLAERTLSGAGAGLNEYSIGLDVFGKPASFDPRLESVVRNEVSRLRHKLGAYYQREGSKDRMVVEIPKRSYSLTFTFVDPVPEARPAPADMASVVNPVRRTPVANWKWRSAAGATALTLAFGAVVWTELWHASRKPRRMGNAAAEDLYLKGRYYWDKRSAQSLLKAMDFFTHAIVQDPNYARAYVGLADCYNLLPEYSAMRGKEAYPRAIEAAKRAVQLDDSSAEGHASLGFSLAYWTWYFPGAEREFERAIALNPNYVPAHHWYATMLMTLGRNEEARKEIETARKLDPASISILADEGLILFEGGRQKEAITLLKELQASEPAFPSTYRYLARIAFARGDYVGGLGEMREMASRLHDPNALVVAAATQKGFTQGGLQGMLLATKRLNDEGLVPTYQVAEAYALAGQKRHAIEYLRRAFDQREPGILGVRGDEALVGLRGQRDFQEIVRGVAGGH